MKYLLFIPLLLSFFATQTTAVHASDTPTIFFCVGNNPQPPCATVAPSQPQTTTNPSTTGSVTISTQPSVSGTTASGGASPTTDPCQTSLSSVTIQSASSSAKKTKKNQKKQNNKENENDNKQDHNKIHYAGKRGLVQQLFQLLLQLILKLLELLGIHITPITTGNPCPTPTQSSIVSPTVSISPSTISPSSTTPAITIPTPTNGASTGNKNPSGQPMPIGNVPGWKQIFADDFIGTVPVGAFSDCDHNANSPKTSYCNGLKPYADYFKNWWAYPNTWKDTAKSGADGNTGAPFGGMYHPEDTVSVNNGVMHIRMYRPSSGGDNHAATVVPKLCASQKYGRYVERFKVVKADPGYKSAHLFYDGGFEIDYPENDYGTSISAYTHPGEANFSTNAKWTDWHTTAIEWTSGSVKFYMDGSLIGTTTNKVPNIPMTWILQNESSILGPYAKPGAVAQLDIDWVACYAQG
ncbi:MAG TPA: glycoside hydrolase family 16 protein [Candidatus Sulfotelmatobacter sp.]|nr:glycoside hydrolase family 16 protein [Candidatus Sulfotelmatobacter sp.]